MKSISFGSKITAELMVNIGKESLEKMLLDAWTESLASGSHINSTTSFSKIDIDFSFVLVDKGFPAAEMVRMGVWHIGNGFVYSPSTGKWSTSSRIGTWYNSKTFDDFIEKYYTNKPSTFDMFESLDDDCIATKGKYKGKSRKDIALSDEKYYAWVLRKEAGEE